MLNMHSSSTHDLPAPAMRGKRPQAREMQILNLDALERASLNTDPFSFVTFSGFVNAGSKEMLRRDFPRITQPGSFPVTELNYGPAFGMLLDELRSNELTQAMGKKFGMDLSDLPLLITVRGRCRGRDGKIHTDAVWKVISCLLYLNEPRPADGGRLRLLRRNDIEDAAVEIAPDFGNVVAFKRSERSFHGHRPYEGERLVIQLNWVTGQKWIDKELARHRRSAWMKRLFPFLSHWGYSQ